MTELLCNIIKMKLSIILPTYQPKSYIYQCFKSLENQSCSKIDFEVIVILNGDKEPYYNELSFYLSKSNLQFKLIYTDVKGVSNARNVGIDYAQQKQSEYIIFIDDDDKLSTGFIEDCLSKASKSHVVVCNVKTFINDEDTVLGDDYISRCYNKNIGKKYNIFSYRCFFSSVCAKLIPLHVIDDFRFDTRFRIGEDSLFGFQISKNINKCVLSNEDSIYLRRIREGSASRSKRTFRYKLRNYSMLISTYTKIYFSDIRRYDFLFYGSRVYASLLNIFK